MLVKGPPWSVSCGCGMMVMRGFTGIGYGCMDPRIPPGLLCCFISHGCGCLFWHNPITATAVSCCLTWLSVFLFQGAAGMPPSYSQSYPGAGPYPPAGMYPPPGGHYGPGTGRPMGPVPHPGAMPPMGYAPGPYPGPAVPGPYPPARMDPALTGSLATTHMHPDPTDPYCRRNFNLTRLTQCGPSVENYYVSFHSISYYRPGYSLHW